MIDLPLETRVVTAEDLLRAIDQRLIEAASVLLPEGGTDRLVGMPTGPGWAAAVLLEDLFAACPGAPGPAHWLLLLAVTGRGPEASAVRALARQLELDGPEHAARTVLDSALPRLGEGRPDLPMRIVRNAVVVDVDYCSRHETNTGIQRVVRHIMPRWRDRHDIVPVAAIDEHTAYRSLSPYEQAHVFDFGRHRDQLDRSAEAEFVPELVVPWQTTVVLPELPHPHSSPFLSALAEFSGNRVGIVAYDMIPIITTELRPFGEAGIFQRYLTIVKHAHRVAGISSSATTEFQGFADMLPSQGLPGPRVAEVELAEDVGEPAATSWRPGPRPVIVVPGRRELHKNVNAVLHAAHRLWAEGLDFEVITLGGAGWDMRLLDQTVEQLLAEDRPLKTLGWVTDEQMWQTIREASFTVFVSLHEGYGLPIAESLSCGTPVITTNYGSQQEIAAKGGCLLVDPRDPTALTDAMRLLITDPDRLAQLRAEIPGRPRRTWDDYADELWDFFLDDRPRETLDAS